jgi:hypothetical protein
MKALLAIAALLTGFSANAEQASRSCSHAAVKVARQMYLGTSSTEGRDVRATARIGFDENSDNVYVVTVIEQSVRSNYKVAARGNSRNCEILSATKLNN